VVIDGKIVHSGGVPSREKVAGWLGTGEESIAATAPVVSGCGCAGRV
jgi:hypothetical protein